MSERYWPLVQLTLARWRSSFRDRNNVVAAFFFPIAVGSVAGFVFRPQPPEPTLCAVEDTPGSDAVIALLADAPLVHVERLDPPRAREALRTGKVSLVVVPGAVITYRFDPSRPESRLARLGVDDALQRGAGRRDVVTTGDSPSVERGSRYIDFLMPGLIALNLLSSSLWGTTYALVEMRIKRLLKRLTATPMRKIDFLASFVVMRVLFLTVELPVLLAFSWFVFGVGVRGNWLTLVGFSAASACAFAGLGLLVGARARNPKTTNSLLNVINAFSVATSGIFFSTTRFPVATQSLIRLLPLTAATDGMRAIMVDGAGPTSLLAPAAVLIAWLVVSLSAAVALFHWK